MVERSVETHHELILLLRGNPMANIPICFEVAKMNYTERGIYLLEKGVRGSTNKGAHNPQFP